MRTVCFLLLLAGLWFQLLPPARADAGVSAVVFHQAAFADEGCLAGENRAPVVVELPDQWRERGQLTPATGCYRLHFSMPAVGALQAVSIAGFSSTHRVWLNGVLLAARGVERGFPARTIPVSRLIDVPAALWHAGDNELAIEVSFSGPSRAGLGQVQVGPAAAAREEFEWRQAVDVQLPAAINLAAAAMAALLLSIWAVRREERALGLLGLLFLIGSLRNYAYARESVLLTPAFSDWLFYVAQVWTAALLTLFVIELDGGRFRRVGKPLLVIALGLSAAGILAAASGQLFTLRTVVYPVLLAALLLLVGWLAWMAVMQRSALLGGLSLSLITVAASGAHDYLAVTGREGATSFFWMPLSMPLVLGVFSVLLVRRFVRAMNMASENNRTLELRVAERTAQLEAANAAKSRFLAAASHDLRQPLHAMGMLAGSMMWSGGLAGDPRLARLQGMIEQLEGLLSGVLDLSRIEAGAVQPRLQTCALDALLQDLEQEVAPLAQAKGLRLRMKRTRLCGVSDPLMLRACLANLVGNAIKYTARGSVLVGCRWRGDVLRIEVRDSGAGLEAAQLARVFGEFYRARPEDAAVPGFGLGLAIVDRYARLLGHHVDVRSEPGRGSCFALELTRAGRGAGEAAPPVPAASSGLHGTFVLVLEEDQALREATRELLEAWQCTVLAAGSEREARVALSLHLRAPDLILADAGQGLESVLKLRGLLGEAVPALILTADIQPAHLARLRAAGLDALPKPIAPARLHEAVANAARARRAEESGLAQGELRAVP